MKTLYQFDPSDFKASSVCHFLHCVKVAHKDDVVAVADSKNPDRKPLIFNKDEWNNFIAGVKNNEFDF